MYSQDQKDKIQLAICSLWETLAKTSDGPMSISKQRGYLLAFGAAGLPVAQIEKACGLAMMRSTWFPMPAELIAMVSDSPDQQCEKAWGQLIEAVRVYGSCDEIVFGDPALIGTIKSMGGLREIANTPTKSLIAYGRKRFDETYKTLIGTSGKPLAFKTSRRIPRDPVTQELLRAPVRKAIGADGLLIEESRDPNTESLLTGLAGQMKIGSSIG